MPACRNITISALRLVIVVSSLPFSMPACASQSLQTSDVGLPWGIPFVGFLGSIAFGQTLFPEGWGRNYGKVTIFWIATILVSMTIRDGTGAIPLLAQLLVSNYLPFIVSILALYTISGGLHLRTRMSGLPRENTILLALGTGFAGLLGTSAATLLFLRLLLTANKWRRHRVHTLVFLILLVANIGGGLTPLGPPLLIGYLKGVSFTWTVKSMLLPTVLISGVLIATYYALDSQVFFKREDVTARIAHRQEHDIISITGTSNLVLLLAAIFLQIICGSWKAPSELRFCFVTLSVSDLARLVGLLALSAISQLSTSRNIRKINQFSWAPMKEVGVIFAGIFITIFPVLVILEGGTNGAMGGLIRLVTDLSGQPINWAYFIATGLVSSILDNAPTFLVFFDVAGGDAGALMGPKATTLVAISAGAVFWGGLTYIGNGPNFMVRSIAQEQDIRMPNFFAYIGWSSALLVPALILTAWIFFV
jgi:Na+/H+ antiporter NhaD/arsenite permease-like protein